LRNATAFHKGKTPSETKGRRKKEKVTSRGKGGRDKKG